MVDLRQVEDLDQLNIIHVTGTKGKVRRGGKGGADGVSGSVFPCPGVRGFNAAVSPGLGMRLHRVHPPQLRAEDGLLQVGRGDREDLGGGWWCHA